MILAATGLKREARIVTAPGIVAIAGGGDAERLERELDAHATDASAIISIGLGGGLSPGLRPGDWVVADRIMVSEDEAIETDPRWRANLVEHLPNARIGTIIGRARMVASISEKQVIHNRTGALAVDMESHIVARIAQRHRLPLMALRTISDSAHHSLPPAAQAGMKPDGEMAVGAVLLALAANPFQLPALIRTGFAAEAAFRSLLRCHMLAGARIGLPDFSDHSLNMA